MQKSPQFFNQSEQALRHHYDKYQMILFSILYQCKFKPNNTLEYKRQAEMTVLSTYKFIWLIVLHFVRTVSLTI